MLKYCIIIPCYNEEKRILTEQYLSFINNNSDFNLLFVDDGSRDDTSLVLQKLSQQSKQIEVLILDDNVGKAEAIRQGMAKALREKTFQCYGYLDADLAIPFSELLRLKEKVGEGYDFVFSSKKETHGSELEVKRKRYFVGRVLSAMVKGSLKLNIYDTQCGCKLMTRDVAEIGFLTPFMSSWLFDVELIWRIITYKGEMYFNEKALEVPVNKLIDRGGSRIKITDLFSLPFEFLKIHSYYTKLQKKK